jgi:hypothetical protein
MGRHFCFAPLPEVIAMAGGPQPRPDALLTRLDELANQKLAMDRKTLKRALTSSSLPPQTKGKLDDFSDGLLDEASVPPDMCVRLTDEEAYPGMGVWEAALDGLEQSCPSDRLSASLKDRRPLVASARASSFARSSLMRSLGRSWATLNSSVRSDR